MSETLPISESFLLTAIGMLIGCCGGVLTCILKSRCTKISFCGITLERDVIPANNIDSVNVDLTNVPNLTTTSGNRTNSLSTN